MEEAIDVISYISITNNLLSDLPSQDFLLGTPIVSWTGRAIDYYAQFTQIRSLIGTLYLAIFYFIWGLLITALFPIMWLGYLPAVFFYWIWPNNSITFWFAAWFFQVELNYAVWKSFFGSDFWLGSTLNWNDQNNILWNLFWFWLWFPMWLLFDILFITCSVPAGLFMGWW